jgi:hypothetical protein
MTEPGWPLVELRRYTLRPGTREQFVQHFETELVESQEAEGLRVGGIFTDLDRPDAFVWLRGFGPGVDPGTALRAFYSGPAWRRHGPAANAMMIDSDDVVALRPVPGAADLPAPAGERAPAGATAAPGYRVLAGVVPGDPDPVTLGADLTAAVGTPVAVLRTDGGPNYFPPLPLREEQAVAWFATVADDTRLAAAAAAVAAALAGLRHELLRLAPTPRAHHHSPAEETNRSMTWR